MKPFAAAFRPGSLSLLAAALTLLTGRGPALAQDVPGGQPASKAAAKPDNQAKPVVPAEAYDGRLVREVRLLQPAPDKPGQTIPLDQTTTLLVQNQLRVEAGQPFRAQTVKEDLTRINRLGRFKTIDSDVQLMTDGSVVVTYLMAEQPMIQDVQVIGNRELSDQELLKEVSVLAGTPVDRFQIDRSARTIEDLYRTKGYYRVRVAIDEKDLADSGIVVFRVIEGDRVKVTDIRFEGNVNFSAKELRSAITTTTYFPIFEKGPLDDDVLAADKTALERFYKDRGYLDTRADTRIQPSPDGSEAIVTFLIAEGPLYNLRSVRILYNTPGALAQYRAEVLKDPRADIGYLTSDQMLQINRRAFSDAQAAGLLFMKPGDVYSEDKLRKSLDAIRSAYGKLGYVLDTGRGPVTAQVEPREVRDDKSPQVDLLLFVKEGEPYTTGEIIVRGNDLTKQQVILRQIQVKPDRPLDNEAIDDSRKRLESLRLFEPASVRITVQPEDPDRPGVRDVLTEVRETNTGEFNFGAAIASDSGVIGRIGIVQRNFDIADFPDSWGEMISGRAFRGAGQNFDVELMPGTEQSVYSISLSDPYFLESNYSAGAAASYRLRQFDQYDQRTYGGRLSLGRRFGAVWQGNAFLRADNVKLYHIDADAPVDDFEDAGPSNLVGLGFELVRNTTDDRFRPSRGSRVGLGIEQVGGDYTFTKLDYQYATFFAVNESFLGYKTILKLQNNVGYIPQGQDAVPVYERYYLGGQNFRGFAYRTVSPKGIRNDTKTQGTDPVGGVFSFFLGAEINQPLYKDIFSVVFFVDTGTVDTDVSFDNYRISVGVGARFYIKGLSPLPIALDFGFPVVKQFGDDSRLFTFSIDLPYN